MKKQYRMVCELYIKNEYLPSPIKVVVGSNSKIYLNKFLENKVLELCKRYNYVGKLNLYIKIIHKKIEKHYKSVFVDNRYKCLYYHEQNNDKNIM